MVVVEAEHLCMTMRGVQKPSSTMVTSMVTGVFKEDVSTKDEFLRLIGR
jgi:GTP cyclohydrolase IA